eukprot:COSAG06_NODE_1395_length_9594_cov_1.634650_5_plen_71_part_01
MLMRGSTSLIEGLIICFGGQLKSNSRKRSRKFPSDSRRLIELTAVVVVILSAVRPKVRLKYATFQPRRMGC